VLPFLEEQVQAAIAAPLAFAPARNTDLSDAAEARSHGAAAGILLEFALNRSQQFVGGIASKVVQTPREGPGLDEFHNVIVPQCGRRRKWRMPAGQMAT